MATDDRGFKKMTREDPQRQKEIASKGGHESGGKFEKGSKRASEAGKSGAANQPLAAKRRGGEHSHMND